MQHSCLTDGPSEAIHGPWYSSSRQERQHSQSATNSLLRNPESASSTIEGQLSRPYRSVCRCTMVYFLPHTRTLVAVQLSASQSWECPEYSQGTVVQHTKGLSIGPLVWSWHAKNCQPDNLWQIAQLVTNVATKYTKP